jgi:hypothetical protein
MHGSHCGNAGRPRGRRERKPRAAAALAVVALVSLAAVACSSGEADRAAGEDPRMTGPAPTPTDSPSTDAVWSLERIRSEGSPENQTVTESGITTRAYVVCDGPRSACKSDPPLRVPYQHAALEVTQDGRSALFGVGANVQYWAAGFDADSVFVMDDPRDDAWGDPQRVRYRLLRANGTEVQLRLLDDPAPAIPGPDVFVIDHGSEPDFDDFEHVYLVDEREGTLRPLDVPHLLPDDPSAIDARYWGPNVDEFLWFVDRSCSVSWATGGTFEERRVDCAEGWDRAYMHDDWFPDGWLQPGRMALVERNHDRLFLHVSLDYGNTWQRIPVSDEDAIPDTLQRLG